MKKYLKFLPLLLVSLFIAFPLFAQSDSTVVNPPVGGGLNIWTIISGVLAVVAAIFGTALTKVKKKISQFVDLAKQAVELLAVVSNAIGDNTVTPEEIASMKQEIADVKAAWKALWSKS